MSEPCRATTPEWDRANATWRPRPCPLLAEWVIVRAEGVRNQRTYACDLHVSVLLEPGVNLVSKLP